MNGFENNKIDSDEKEKKDICLRFDILKNHQKQLVKKKKRLLTELRSIEKEQDNLNNTIINIEKEIEAKNKSGIRKESPKNYISAEIHSKLIKLKGFNEKIEYVKSVDMGKQDILAILLKPIEHDDDYLFQCWIIDSYIQDVKLLIDLIEHDFSDNDPYKFKMDLKLKAVNHEAADEELLKVAIESDEFDVRQAAYNSAINNKKFAHISKSIALQFEKDRKLLNLFDLNKLIMNLSNNIIPNKTTKEELEESIIKFCEAVKKSDDTEFIVEMSSVIESAKYNVDSYFMELN